MITIRNTKLFKELTDTQDTDPWETLMTKGLEYQIPTLWGGLDHIKIKPKGVYFYDRGVNDKNNSFVVRPESKV